MLFFPPFNGAFTLFRLFFCDFFATTRQDHARNTIFQELHTITQWDFSGDSAKSDRHEIRKKKEKGKC